MDIPDTRLTLLQRLGDRHDASAWSEFCTIYERTIYNMARRYQLQDADAREVSQEVLLRLSRRISEFDPHRDGRFRSWLATIARNAAIDLLRRERRHRRPAVDENDSPASGPQDESQRMEQEPMATDVGDAEERLFELESRREQFRWAAEQVRSAVSESSWKAFWRTAVEGNDPGCVANELDISVGAVYVARCRVLAKMKRLIEPFREESL